MKNINILLGLTLSWYYKEVMLFLFNKTRPVFVVGALYTFLLAFELSLKMSHYIPYWKCWNLNLKNSLRARIMFLNKTKLNSPKRQIRKWTHLRARCRWGWPAGWRGCRWPSPPRRPCTLSRSTRVYGLAKYNIISMLQWSISCSN